MYQPIRNKNHPWPPCFLSDQDQTKKLYKGPSIDATYQILIHLAKWFQRRRFFNVSANQKQELPLAPMFVDRSGRNEQSL